MVHADLNGCLVAGTRELYFQSDLSSLFVYSIFALTISWIESRYTLDACPSAICRCYPFVRIACIYRRDVIRMTNILFRYLDEKWTCNISFNIFLFYTYIFCRETIDL